jgi:hypothetical protein
MWTVKYGKQSTVHGLCRYPGVLKQEIKAKKTNLGFLYGRPILFSCYVIKHFRYI